MDGSQGPFESIQRPNRSEVECRTCEGNPSSSSLRSANWLRSRVRDNSPSKIIWTGSFCEHVTLLGRNDYLRECISIQRSYQRLCKSSILAINSMFPTLPVTRALQRVPFEPHCERNGARWSSISSYHCGLTAALA